MFRNTFFAALALLVTSVGVNSASANLMLDPTLPDDTSVALSYNATNGNVGIMSRGQSIGLFQVLSAGSHFTAGTLPAGGLFPVNTAGEKALAAFGPITSDHSLGAILPTGWTSEQVLADITGLWSGGFGFPNSPFDFVCIECGVTGSPDIELNLDGMLVPSGGLVDFGLVVQGAAAQRTLSIANTGDADLVLGVPSLSGPFSLVGDFPETIGAGASADFIVAADTSTYGPLAGLLEFGTNVDGVATYSVELGGQVIPEPSSIALCGLALIGLVGCARRRK